MRNRKPIVNSRTDNFPFSVSFDPDDNYAPVECFIVGRGRVGQELDEELL